MDTAIEILQQTTTTWTRWLIFLAITLMFFGIRFYEQWRKHREETDTMQKIQTTLKIRKLLLEIELIEMGLKYQDFDKMLPRIQLKNNPPATGNRTPSTSLFWHDKVIYGLLGSLFFLIVLVLLYLFIHLHELQMNPYSYVPFTRELFITLICGAGVALIPGKKGQDFFFYGFIAPMLLTLLLTELNTWAQ